MKCFNSTDEFAFHGFFDTSIIHPEKRRSRFMGTGRKYLSFASIWTSFRFRTTLTRTHTHTHTHTHSLTHTYKKNNNEVAKSTKQTSRFPWILRSKTPSRGSYWRWASDGLHKPVFLSISKTSIFRQLHFRCSHSIPLVSCPIYLVVRIVRADGRFNTDFYLSANHFNGAFMSSWAPFRNFNRI